MFGLLKPCSVQLGPERFSRWMGHYCGQCLAISDSAGQWPRLVTNCDTIALSVLVEARTPTTEREAGRCALRGMRKQSIPEGPGVDLAAFASLALASAKIRDHVEDGDGLSRTGLGRGLSSRAARSLADRARRLGERVELEVEPLFAQLRDHGEAERSAADLMEAVAPSARATSLLFAHTSHWADGADRNALAEAGHRFGAAAHLLDAVEDFADDRAGGRWNPLEAHGLTPAEGFQAASREMAKVREGLESLAWRDGTLVHALFAHLAPHALAGADPDAADCEPVRERRGFVEGLCPAAGMCCTGEWCWAEEYEGPWSRKKRQGCCKGECGCEGQQCCCETACRGCCRGCGRCCETCCEGCDCGP
ncbi:DUF5685 family protein [Salininema proteolyticum]|uniref:DUF5685 family protein n=1 Tax=Salininema proteolyticum TaxID=1607685 RepID=A0ABV8TW93_9ACTN